MIKFLSNKTYRISNTGVPMDKLKKIGEVMCTIPPGFTPHPTIKKTIQQRKHMIDTGQYFTCNL